MEIFRDLRESGKEITPDLVRMTLKEYGIPYKEERATNNAFLQFKISNLKIEIYFNYPQNQERIPGCLYCGSRADSKPVWLQILDWDEEPCRDGKLQTKEWAQENLSGKELERYEYFLYLHKSNAYEANYWHCAQWGTWKFIPRDWEELERWIQKFKEFQL